MTTMAPSQMAWLQGKDCMHDAAYHILFPNLYSTSRPSPEGDYFQASDLKFNGQLATPNYPSTAHCPKLDLSNTLAPTGHKPRTSNRVKMSCEKQLKTQIDEK